MISPSRQGVKIKKYAPPRTSPKKTDLVLMVSSAIQTRSRYFVVLVLDFDKYLYSVIYSII